MTKPEAIRLLALIKVAYPTAYKDMDQASKQATVNMWHMSFPDVPFPIMEQAFNHFRMVSKYPPTVAEMVEELKHIHFHATECALIHRAMDNEEGVRQYRAIMACTSRYKDSANIGYGNMANLLIGGGNDVHRLGTPGDNQSIEDRLSLVDAT